MAHIGLFKRTSDGYAGSIRTLTLDRDVVIITAVARDADNAPDYRVLTGEVEIGAGWKRTGERAGDYVSLVIDDPSFTHPIRANLFHLERDSDIFHLSWTRPARRDNRG
jgi:uncharacterized protein (DUF736 family)